MSSNTQSVAAVVVTYNRKELLDGCLQALLSQTQPLDGIIVVDNASADGTPEFLRERGYLDNPKIDYVRLPENSGGAGGFHEGVKTGYQKGFGWLWLMDDDAVPAKDALEVLLNADISGNPQVGALVCSIRDEKTDFDRRVQESVMRCERVFRNREIQKEQFGEPALQISSYPLLGVLLKREVVDSVGNVDKEFFIQSDDLDYTLRISEKHSMYLIRDSILVHKEQRSLYVTKSLFGKKINFLTIKQQWKDYYGCRNYIYLVNKKATRAATLRATYNYLRYMGLAVLLADHKGLRIALYSRALKDAFKGNLGKRIDPGDWNRRL